MTALTEELKDHRGSLLFLCQRCERPLTGDDLIAQGLRLPDPDESRDDYFEAELIDQLDHQACTLARQVS